MNSVDLRGPRQGKSKAATLPAYSRKRDGFWIRNQATLREYVLLHVCPQACHAARRVVLEGNHRPDDKTCARAAMHEAGSRAAGGADGSKAPCTMTSQPKQQDSGHTRMLGRASK